MKSLLWVLPLVAQRRAAFVGTILSSLLHQVSILALSVASALFLGQALFGDGFEGTWRMLAVAIGALTLVVGLAAWWEMYISHDLAYALLAVLRSGAYEELSRSTPARTTARAASDDTTAVMGDVETLEWLFAHTIAQALTSAVVLGIGGTLSAMISPQLVGIWVAAAVLLFVIPLACHRWGVKQSTASRAASVQLHSLFVESVQGFGDLAAAGATEDRMRRITSDDRELARWQLRSAARTGLESALSQVIVSAAATAAVVAMGVAERDGRAAPELVAVAMVLLMGSLGPAAQIAGLLGNFGALIASARRVHAVYIAPDAAPAAATPRAPDSATLTFEDVRFGYDPSTPVLHDVSFTIEPGERVALAGASGAGKSTIASLALRMWDPDAGRVLVGHVPASAIADSDLRRTVTAVPQEAQLLRGTVRSNISLALPTAASAQVDDAARAAGLCDPRAGLPAGLDTPVGERGAGLSGGQRARVSLARALLSGARIIVLDEAAAHLDPRSEEDVNTALRARTDLATLVIAHRKQTILDCDRVIVLAEGRVVEEGVPDRLLADPASALHALLLRAPSDAAPDLPADTALA